MSALQNGWVAARCGRAWLAAALLLAPGCVSVPVESAPRTRCTAWGSAGGGPGPCQRHLVVGLFPAIGEAHLNHLATNGKRLTPGLRAADYSLRPLYITGLNVLSLGFPTARAWLLEPYDDYDPAPRSCQHALLGYCKSARLRPGEEGAAGADAAAQALR